MLMSADTTDKQDEKTFESSKRRFVVLHHTGHPVEADHYDLMIEDRGVLMTWRVPIPPQDATRAVAVTALPSHRIAYLTYEGPISNNRGRVARHDAGTCVMKRNASDWQITFCGKHLRGNWEIKQDATTNDVFLQRQPAP